MSKPTTHVSDPYYCWSEIEDYILEKYHRDVTDWYGKWTNRGTDGKIIMKDVEVCDFWNWLCENHCIENGRTETLCIDEDLDDPDPNPGIVEILNILKDEFGAEFDIKVTW